MIDELWAFVIPLGVLFGGLARLYFRSTGGEVTYAMQADSMDHLTCQQMRESGWSERKIRDWMRANNGRYYPPEGISMAQTAKISDEVKNAMLGSIAPNEENNPHFTHNGDHYFRGQMVIDLKKGVIEIHDSEGNCLFEWVGNNFTKMDTISIADILMAVRVNIG